MILIENPHFAKGQICYTILYSVDASRTATGLQSLPGQSRSSTADLLGSEGAVS